MADTKRLNDATGTTELDGELSLAHAALTSGDHAGSLARARGVERRAVQLEHTESELQAGMIKALSLLLEGRAAKAADVGECLVERQRELDNPLRLDAELHLVAALALNRAHRSGAAEAARETALRILDQRAAENGAEGALEQVEERATKWFPPDIRDDVRGLLRRT